jgi:hypothetical protein
MDGEFVCDAVVWSSRSADGAVSYSLSRDGSDVLLERTLVRPGGQVFHAVQLLGEKSFQRWCEADDVRFTHPLLFSELRRRCSEELESARASQR